ncbi:MAG TPA: nucleotide exchange factor GrpE [Candidatus Angelobacter sp.]|jgi:molecular chaperone GrpE
MDTEHQLQAQDRSHEESGPVQRTSGTPNALANQADAAPRDTEYQVLLDRFARMQADFENFRKRMAREQLDFKKSAVADALTSLLPALDSFELALASTPPTVEEFRSGMELIQRQLRAALEKLGLETVPAKGERFNPHLHEAVEVVDQPEVADEQVIHQLRRGYRMGDRILRPSMVVVARKPAN